MATQSIAVLSTLLASYADQPYRLELNFIALSMWLWGGMLYIWMMSLIFYRYTFFRLAPGDLTPPYWINMGAMAISTLAGTLLIQNAPRCAIFEFPASVSEGIHDFLLGNGNVVDPDAGGVGPVAPCPQAVSAKI